jgi:hypothetical protein
VQVWPRRHEEGTGSGGISLGVSAGARVWRMRRPPDGGGGSDGGGE